MSKHVEIDLGGKLNDWGTLVSWAGTILDKGSESASGLCIRLQKNVDGGRENTG